MYKNGIMVEIVNIDVEGCLVLVDGLIVVVEFQVKYIVDVVMLIGVVMVVLGYDYYVVFSLNFFLL